MPTIVGLLINKAEADVSAERRTHGSTLAGVDDIVEGGSYRTALQAASSNGHIEIVKQLLKAGADVNFQGGYNDTALQCASCGGHKEIVEQLLKAGLTELSLSLKHSDTFLMYLTGMQPSETYYFGETLLPPIIELN